MTDTTLDIFTLDIFTSYTWQCQWSTTQSAAAHLLWWHTQSTSFAHTIWLDLTHRSINSLTTLVPSINSLSWIPSLSSPILIGASLYLFRMQNSGFHIWPNAANIDPFLLDNIVSKVMVHDYDGEGTIGGYLEVQDLQNGPTYLFWSFVSSISTHNRPLSSHDHNYPPWSIVPLGIIKEEHDKTKAIKNNRIEEEKGIVKWHLFQLLFLKQNAYY